MEIIWIGHSCFKITECNYSIIIDPYREVPGLREINEEANLVLVTHDHSDHNAIDRVRIEKTNNNFNIKSIELSHDKQGGKLRGKNSGYVIKTGKFKVAHFGDIGCELRKDLIEELDNLDVLLIPVGGTYTIGGKEAVEIIETLKPKIAIPMHYRDLKYNFGFQKLEDINLFIHHAKEVVYTDESKINLNSVSFKLNCLFRKHQTKIVILKPQNIKTEK